MTCRVFIADDVPELRLLVREMLEEDEAISVVGEANNGLEAVAGVMAHRPDLLLLDLAMPVMDGIEVLFHLRDKSLDTKVVVLSGFASDRMAALALDLGAERYLEKGVGGPSLRRTVREVCDTCEDERAA